MRVNPGTETLEKPKSIKGAAGQRGDDDELIERLGVGAFESGASQTTAVSRLTGLVLCRVEADPAWRGRWLVGGGRNLDGDQC